MCDLAVAVDTALLRFQASMSVCSVFTPARRTLAQHGAQTGFEMLVTGDFIDAQEARARGLINRVVPVEQLDEAVDALVSSICSKSPVAVAMGKQRCSTNSSKWAWKAYQVAGEVMACND